MFIDWMIEANGNGDKEQPLFATSCRSFKLHPSSWLPAVSRGRTGAQPLEPSFVAFPGHKQGVDQKWSSCDMNQHPKGKELACYATMLGAFSIPFMGALFLNHLELQLLLQILQVFCVCFTWTGNAACFLDKSNCRFCSSSFNIWRFEGQKRDQLWSQDVITNYVLQTNTYMDNQESFWQFP